jgi:hypothetical protein
VRVWVLGEGRFAVRAPGTRSSSPALTRPSGGGRAARAAHVGSWDSKGMARADGESLLLQGRRPEPYPCRESLSVRRACVEGSREFARSADAETSCQPKKLFRSGRTVALCSHFWYVAAFAESLTKVSESGGPE